MYGKLALAGIDLRVPADTWLDAVYAIVVEAPGDEALEKLHRRIVTETARLRPDRETWGLLPEQAALQQRLTGHGRSGSAPPARGPSARPPGTPGG